MVSRLADYRLSPFSLLTYIVGVWCVSQRFIYCLIQILGSLTARTAQRWEFIKVSMDTNIEQNCE